jgi:NADPH-dependent glutamate synthase beta subunit-like oxidoreductase
MPQITIDGQAVEVRPGATILDAARKLGIEIPTLCFLDDYEPSTSCLVCMVKVLGEDRLVPSCATPAVDGMRIESETEEVHQVRRTALELLLSDHLGDCLAPCYFACPAQMDIPQMLRQIAVQDLRGAIATVKSDIALPGVLGRICPAPCEKACRRRPADGPVAICRLKRFVADSDMVSGDRYVPPCKPPSGKTVAIIGAGPTGLSAAYYLLGQGHACTVLDQNAKPGGRLHEETSPQELPREVIAADVEPIVRLGAELKMNTRVDSGESFERLRHEFDAVLIACGATATQQAQVWQLETGPRGLTIEKPTYRTNLVGVFAAGNTVCGKGLVVRSSADGKEAATAIDQYVSGRPVTGPHRPFNVKLGRLEPGELAEYLAGASQTPPREPAGGPGAGYTSVEATEQAARCMHCDCRGVHSCKLRKYADLYQADPRRYASERRVFGQDRRHSEVVFEPGKCIDCGLCVEIARAGGEPVGLTFIGRGFDVRVGVPLGGTLDAALRHVAAECVAACPTAALSWARETRPSSSRPE